MNTQEIILSLNLSIQNVMFENGLDVKGVSTLINNKENTLIFCGKKYIHKLSNIKNCIVFIPNDIDSLLPTTNTYIVVDNPRLNFIRTMHFLYPIIPEPKINIGKNVKIDKSTIIGTQGFGFERNEEGILEQFICVGGVRIGDNVVIGSNTSIDRGTIDDTVIEEGTKIDNLVHIAHNVQIGKHCEIISHAMLGGSCVIGDYTRIAPGAQIMNGVKIGKNVLVGLGAVVTKDIPDNIVVAGVPARKFKDNNPIYGSL